MGTPPDSLQHVPSVPLAICDGSQLFHSGTISNQYILAGILELLLNGFPNGSSETYIAGRADTQFPFD